MQARLVNIGYGTIIAVDRIIAVVAPESAPIKRKLRQVEALPAEDSQRMLSLPELTDDEDDE